MSARKTPVLLRRSPVTGDVMALLRYTITETAHGDLLRSSSKQDVTADFTALMLEELIDPDARDIVAILDGVADGEPIADEQRAQVRAFRERLAAACIRHNERGHGAPQAIQGVGG